MIPFRRVPGEIRELEEATEAPGFDLLSRLLRTLETVFFKLL